MEYVKLAKHIYSAQYSNKDEEAAYQRLVMDEVRKFIAKAKTEIVSMVLWYMHSEYGFGYDRLKKFYEGIDREYFEMLERYEMYVKNDKNLENIKASAWLATKKLKDYGVDLNAWDGMGEIEVEGKA